MLRTMWRGWSRRQGWLLVMWTAGASWTLALAQPTNAPLPPAPRRPSILLILADNLGCGDLGCYGQNRIQTPNLDKLAGEGIRFTSFYAGSSLGVPSRCALLTGLDTGHGPAQGEGDQSLRPEDLTAAQVLKDANYHSAFIGLWGLGDEASAGVPQRKGFDEVLGYLTQAAAQDFYPDHFYRYAPQSVGSHGFEGQQLYPENSGDKRQLYAPDLFTKAALNYLRIHEPARENHYRPFFLCLSYPVPRAGGQAPSDAPYSDQAWPAAERAKAAMITRLDADVGKLLEALKKYREEENTVVIFTSATGPQKAGGEDPAFFQSCGALRGAQGDLHEGGIRVPLIVRWPFGVKAGRVSDLPLGFVDFLPTAAELARVPAPKQIQGISFYPTLLGQAQTNQHAVLYWETAGKSWQQAARMGDWKAVRMGTGEPLELYNLKTDAGEKTNAAPGNPKIAAALEAQLKAARASSSQASQERRSQVTGHE